MNESVRLEGERFDEGRNAIRDSWRGRGKKSGVLEDNF